MDPIQTQLESGLKMSRDYWTKWVKRSKSAVFWRHWIPIGVAAMFLVLAGFDFYRLRYFSGIINSLEALGFAALNWWISNGMVENARSAKMYFANQIRWWEGELKKYRAYKERGFE